MICGEQNCFKGILRGVESFEMHNFVCSIMKSACYRSFVDTLTLLVLILYAYFTYLIAQISVAQLEHSQIPFLDLVNQPHLEGADIWILKNQGKGPAINIRYELNLPNSPKIMQSICSLAPGDHYEMGRGSYHEMYQRKYRAEYESISRKRYCTMIEWQNGEKKTTFIDNCSIKSKKQSIQTA